MEENSVSIGAFSLEGFDFNTMARTAFSTAAEKGFWDNERNFGELMMLIVSELGEACESHRKGRIADKEEIGDLHEMAENMDKFKDFFEEVIKDTFEDELADTLIRIGDYLGHKDWTISLLVGRPDYDAVADERFPTNVGEMLILTSARITTAYAYGLNEGGEKDLRESLETAVNDIMTIARILDIDIVGHVKAKMAFNKTRERLHGKNY